MTLRQAYQKAVYTLAGIYEPSEAAAIADRLLAHITGEELGYLIRTGEALFPPYHELRLEKFITELLTYKPLQYVLNEAWFMGRPFHVDSRVLIPRPETEELVSWVLVDTEAQNNELGSLKLLDIGTGSGCIGISLQLARPKWQVTALDKSLEALEVAGRNAKDLSAEIAFLSIDVTDDPSSFPITDFDIIVSNPPYIPQSHTGTLALQVEKYEPNLALFVPSEDALLFYRAIGRFGQMHFKDKGALYVEVHHDSAPQVRDLFLALGYDDVQIRKDMQGVERMVKGVWRKAV